MANQQPSDHDMILQMYTELIGLGDGGGLIKEHHEVMIIIPTLMTKEDCVETRKNNKRVKFGIWQTVVGILGIVSGYIIGVLL